MSVGYQSKDIEIIDYNLYSLNFYNTKNNFFFRGPCPESLCKNKYFVCLGAAQTFGRFCQQPYGILLQERLNLSVLNFGTGGAGAIFFLDHSELFEYINNAQFAIIQVMSGRSASNSVFTSERKTKYISDNQGNETINNPRDAYRNLINNNDRDTVRKIIAEVRASWIEDYHKLLCKVKVPKILFWFSTRSQEYLDDYTDVNKLFNKYPQLVNLEMLDAIKDYSDDYVECISKKGIPQQLVNRFTGLPVEAPYGNKSQQYNQYYPSPEMHIDAANMLEPICKKYLK